MTPLQGKRCVLTGASGGLGCHLAGAFARRGCRLALCGRDRVKLDRLARDLQDLDLVDAVFTADLALDEEVSSLATRVLELWGGADILVNNAGVFPVGSLESAGVDDLGSCLAVNLRAPMILSRAFVPAMKARGWGRVVNIASSSAYSGFANSAAYCASKHGLLGFSRALDDELRRHGVRVIAVSPGSIKSEMGRKVQGQTFDTFMEPSEVAELVAHLAELDGSLVVTEARLARMVMG